MAKVTSGSGSYGHRCFYLGHGEYELVWTVDRHYPEDRLRYPRRARRLTDRRGADRFCKRWRITMPTDGASP